MVLALCELDDDDHGFPGCFFRVGNGSVLMRCCFLIYSKRLREEEDALILQKREEQRRVEVARWKGSRDHKVREEVAHMLPLEL